MKRIMKWMQAIPDSAENSRPTHHRQPVHRRRSRRELEPFVAAGGADARHREQEREPGRGERVRPKARPAVIVIPDREVPGISASAWATPMTSACGHETEYSSR